MSKDDAPIRVALRIEDPALADRVARRLAGAAGIRVAAAGEPADIIVTASSLAERDAAFTPRELEVLGLLAEGASNKAIARALGISVHTAKFHVGSLLDKLDAVGRTDAVAQAARLGVIQL